MGTFFFFLFAIDLLEHQLFVLLCLFTAFTLHLSMGFIKKCIFHLGLENVLFEEKAFLGILQ